MILTNSQGASSVFTVEVADTPQLHAKGLMFRKSLAADAGMIFIFDEETGSSFWMKNTPISLDIIFIGKDLKIIGIAKNTTPYSEVPIFSALPYRYVLELNAGAAEAGGIVAGDAVALKL
ncbi:MAG: DUF192 domain-containing protein [Deltaproteobacteria bacterium]|nr:DUF192 domain-containing protein [Deltaproteobacteria bacterium]